MPSPRVRLAALLAGAVLLLASSTAAEQAATPPPGGGRRLLSRLTGIFDFDLPELDPPGTVSFTLHPHFSDLLRRDYLRVAGGVRWTVTESLELGAELEAFGTHGLRHGPGSRYGVGEVRAGAKRVFTGWPQAGLNTSFDLEVQVPTGRPPLEMTDGFNHVTPSTVVEHRWKSDPRMTTFGSLGLDFLSDSSTPGLPGRNQPVDDSAFVGGGLVYDFGEVKWTLEATYANTWIAGSNHHFFNVRPSIVWFVPRNYTFNSKTQWIVGFGVRSTWGPDGHELSSGTRVRAELTFGQVLDQIKQTNLHWH